jgi:Protein of unknown function (DUF642)/PEP-CTERM motif
MKRTLLALALGGSAMAAATAHAAAITNGSFETDGPSLNNAFSPGIGSTEITGWTVINNDGSTTDNGRNVLWIGNGGFGLFTPFGTSFIDLTGTSDSTPFDGLTQTVSTVAGQSYKLTFDLGAQGTTGAFGGPISVMASAGATSGTFLDSGVSTPGSTTINGTVWTPETLAFTATSASTAISFVGETGIQFIGLDNVSLGSSVPEPASWAMLLVGFGGLGAVMRAQRKQPVSA